jgi:beta-lactamase regulating signal transducer with metallopeptidase domain
MSDLIDQVDSFGHALAVRFGALNVWTALLLAGALVLDRALSRRARASFRIALYAPVALRVVLPLDWSLKLSHAPQVETLFAPLARITASDSAAPSSAHPAPWFALVALAYVAGATLLAARAVIARVRLARALASAAPVARVDAGTPCPIVEHESLGPMAVGLLSPRIVVPRRLLAPGEESALACVLRHEGAHLRRGDAWLSAVMQLLAMLAWPVVPLWIAMGRVRQLVELACDEAALDGADATERRRYGHALLDIAEWSSFAVATGAGELHFGSTLRARIEALTSQRHWPVAAQALVVSLAPMALLTACAASTPPRVATTAGDLERDTDYGYEFDTDSAKAAAAAPASGTTPTLNADGRVAPEAIQASVRARFSAIVACYETGRAKDPQLAGKVNVKLVIGEDGVTREASDNGSTLPDKDVVACIVGDLRAVTYPKGPGVLTVVYPIELTP